MLFAALSLAGIAISTPFYNFACHKVLPQQQRCNSRCPGGCCCLTYIDYVNVT
jgi:hypothetical protein